MTLVLNEIHMLNGLARTMTVAAADQRLTYPDGSYRKGKKLFRVSHLFGAVSYFGLATFRDCKGREQAIGPWLADFVKHSHSLGTVGDFAAELRQELNRFVPSTVLSACASGFQICGYNSAGLPEYWSLSNIGGMKDLVHTNLGPTYLPPVNDFLGRDALVLGWDGKDPLSAKSPAKQIYRNGDLRLHIAAWDTMDRAMAVLARLPGASGFSLPNDPASYGRYVQFKFEFIAYFYKYWAIRQLVGRPIDVIVVTRGEGEAPRYVEVPRR